MVYSRLDLATGYHQLAIEPIRTYRTAFKVGADFMNMWFSLWPLQFTFSVLGAYEPCVL